MAWLDWIGLDWIERSRCARAREEKQLLRGDGVVGEVSVAEEGTGGVERRSVLEVGFEFVVE